MFRELEGSTLGCEICVNLCQICEICGSSGSGFAVHAAVGIVVLAASVAQTFGATFSGSERRRWPQAM